MERLIFHIDVNSAYLSWSALELLKEESSKTDIRTIPSIIGGDQASRRGVVLAKSISAKNYGVVTGEPIAKALQKCPNLIIVPPDHTQYKNYSLSLMNLLRTFSPAIEQVSIDECYMDFTELIHLYDSPIKAATIIKDTVCNTLGFTVNIGISTKKILAKMASDFKKPNLVHTLYPDEISKKLWPLPVSDLHMVGTSTLRILNKLEIFTIGDLAKTNREYLEIHLKSHGTLIWNYANGIDSRQVSSATEPSKGIGNSTTLANDIDTLEDAKKVLLLLSEKVGKRLRNENVFACNLCVEIKYNTFQTVSHQTKLSIPSYSDLILHEVSCKLFEDLWDKTPVRLLGIRTSKLISDSSPVQLSIFDHEQTKNQKQVDVDKALDLIRKKYGSDSIIRGSQFK